MTTRRDFLRSGTAAALLAAGAQSRAAIARRAAAQPGAFASGAAAAVADRQLDESTAFARAAARRGAAVEAFAGDVAGLFMNRLAPRWRRAPAAVAGLTTAGALFCIEYLARDYGLGVAWRIRHCPAAAGRARHALAGAPPVPDWAERLDAAGRAWPWAAAALVMAQVGRAAPVELIDLGAHAKTEPEPLYSWLLVPTGRPSLCSAAAAHAV